MQCRYTTRCFRVLCGVWCVVSSRGDAVDFNFCAAPVRKCERLAAGVFHVNDVEPGMIAHFSNDKFIHEDYIKGLDIHVFET
jgi:hypothetical protein